MAKNATLVVLFITVAAALFVGGRIAGDWFRSPLPLPEHDERSKMLADGVTDAEDLAYLPPVVAAGGMRAIRQNDGTTLFAHPQSPCWLEVPTPRPANSKVPPGDDQGFVGPDACQPCHAQRHSDFIHTPHYLASSLPTADVMAGEFYRPQRVMKTNHPDLQFEMTAEQGRYSQTVTFRDLVKRFDIDIVTGAGLVGQTHLFWNNEELFQLHVTYFTKPDQWVNSPGYVDGTAWYSRKVIPKCVQCHMTFLDWRKGTENAYDPTSLIAGVTCERCHGPAREHVDFHTAHPDVKKPHAIVDPNDLTADQLNDLCAQCHFGSGTLTGEPFSFRPGDRIEDHWDVAQDDAGIQGSVHSSNQLQRMKRSRCFTESESLTCIDCHNPHNNERGNLRLYSQRCIQCHSPDTCGKFVELGDSISSNCIDCHMPRSPDDHLPMQSSVATEFPLLRDHYIRVVEE